MPEINSKYPGEGVVELRSDVGEGIQAANAQWSFHDVANGFSEHIRRSVPFYDEGQLLVCKLSDYFVGPGSLVYDIGTSTGEMARKLADWNKSKAGVRVVGVDCVPSMIEYCKAHHGIRADLDFTLADILTFDFLNCSLFVSFFTIQFIPPHSRQDILCRIYERLNWGGALIMYEKVRAPDARFQDYLSQIYTDYKSERGYSAEEIVSKSRSLKGVLEPFSTNANLEMLRRAGFSDVISVQKWVCFEGFLAIK